MTDRNLFRYPTPEEMTALTSEAHRNRARWMKVLLRKGIRAVKRSIAPLSAVPAAKGMSHA
jgi:hypothetical protein